MSDDLSVVVRVAVDEAIANLAKAESGAKKAEQAFDGFAATFARIAAVQQRVAAETARAKGAVDNLGGSFAGLARALQAEQLNSTARAFAGLTQQIERERDMLEKIHGPAKQLGQDLQTLEMLYKRGAISAAEYTDQLEKMGQVHGPSKDQAGGGAKSGLSQIMEGASGQIAGVAGPAALAAAGIREIGAALDEWSAREKSVRDATNSILKFHESIDSAKASMGEQRQLAEDLTLNIAKTTRAYADVREATEDFGLSSRQMIDVTRNLSAMLIVDGGSIENVSAIMQKLQYASEANVLTQRDLKSIYMESPEVIHSFEASLGKTYPQLMKMAAEGKINGAVIEQMTKGLGVGHEALDKYKQRMLDVGVVMEENHESLVEAALDVQKAKKGYEELGTSGAEAFNQIAVSTAHNIDVLDKMADKVQLIMSAITVQGRFASDKTLIDNGLKTQEMLNAQKSEWARYTIQLADARKEFERAGLKGKELNDALASIHPPGWVDYYKQEIDAIRQPERDWAGRIAALDGLLKNHTITLEEYNAQLAAVAGHTREVGEGLPRNYQLPAESYKFGGYDVMTGKFERRASSVGGEDQFGHAAGPSLEDIYKSQPDGGAPDVGSFGRAKDALEAYDAALVKHKASLDDIREHLKPIEDGLVQLATTGKVSWSKMIDSMVADLARLATNELWKELLEAISPGPKAPGLGSFAASLGSVVSGGSHATGGSIVAPQTGGGVDSILMLSRVSPGEQVDYTPMGQQKASQGGGGSGPQLPPIVQIIDGRDHRALFQGPDFKRAVHQVFLENPATLKRLLGVR